MPAQDRPSSRAAHTFAALLLFLITAAPLESGVVLGHQSAEAPALEAALRAGDLEKARTLVPEDWAAAEQLFVSSLERAFLSTEATQPSSESRLLAGRLADVFFRIVEYDFARSLVLTLDTADTARRRELLATTRDLFSNLDRRRTLPRSAPPPMDYNTLGLPIFRALADVAARFRRLGLPRGELFTLFCMADINPPVESVHRLAEKLGDELSLAFVQRQSVGNPDAPLEGPLATAERLGLLSTQVDLLAQTGNRQLMAAPPGKASAGQLEDAVKYLERARATAHSIRPLESVNLEWYTASKPEIASVGLPPLFGAYVALKRLTSAREVLSEAVQLSRPFGEDAVLNTVERCGFWTRGMLSLDEAEPLLQASRAVSPSAELRMVVGMAGSGRGFRPDVAERALALAVAIQDTRQRGQALAWYSRNRQSLVRATPAPPASAPPRAGPPSRREAPVFPAAYHELFKLCVEAGEFALVAETLFNQAELQGLSGDVAGAQDTFNEAIRVAQRSGDQALVARVTVWAATGLRSGVVPIGPVKRWPAAIQLEFATRALEAATAADSPGELLIAHWARATVPTATTDQRVADLRAAVAAGERYTQLTGQPRNELRCLAQLSQEYARRGEFQAAVDAERQRAALANIYPSFESVDAQIEAYSEIARIYASMMGEPSLALEAADRARQLAESELLESYRPMSRVDAALNYSRLAALAADIGRPTEALESWGKALAVLAQPDPDNANTVQAVTRDILTSRAETLGRLGDYEASLSDWNEVGSLLQPTGRSFGLIEPLQKAQWLSSVAWTHVLMGSRDKGLELARDAAAIFRQEGADRWQSRSAMPTGDLGIEFMLPNPEEVVTSVIGTVADILILTGHPDEAVAFCDLESIRRQLAERPVAQRIHLEHLAEGAVAAGQIDRARTLLLSAVDIDRAQATAGAGGLGGSFLLLGKLETGAGNYAKAREYLVEALAAVNPYDADRIWQIQRALAIVSGRLGGRDAAVGHYDAALTALESGRERLRPEEFRVRYGFDRLGLYEDLATLLAAKAVQSGKPGDADLAFQAAERKRTQVLWGLLSTGWSRIPSAALPDQLRRLFDLESRIGAKQALLREQFAQPSGKRNTAQVDSLQRELKQLQADHATLLASVAQGQYRYAAPAALAASLAQPVRAALGSSRVLVEYLVTADRSYAFVVTASGTKVVPLAVGREALRARVQKLLQPFHQLRAGELDLARLTYDTRAAFDLYQSIFAPVRPALGRASEIVIVPDDVLTFLPFDALVEQASRPAARGAILHAEFAGEKFLVHRYAISYLSSSAQLLDRAPAAGAQKPRTLFAMANPAAGRPGAPAAGQDDPLKRQLRSGMFDALLTPLPGAESEVQRIARYFPGDAAVVVTGRGATEAAYEGEAGKHSVLHFATHAVASDGQPFYSTLILAPDQAPGHDGFLQAFEVLRTPLGADLVVLSGCETALGTQDVGQGLVGLVAAFQQAGARSVLATLWSIDEATAEVMTNFYSAWAQGASAPVALQQAKRQVLKQRLRLGNIDVSLAHPFFWAPFILTGVAPHR